MMLQDLQYATRALRQNPLFTVVAALSLAIGIGANAAIFTLLDQLLVRPLPLPEPDRLIQLELPGPRSGSTYTNRAISKPMYIELRDGATTLQGVSAHFLASASLSTGDRSQIVPTMLISGTWFDTLGVKVALGRPITPQDDETFDAHPIAVLSHGIWQRRFGSDPAIVNKKIILNGRPLTVIGVTQPGFRGTDIVNPPDIYLPLAMQRLILPNAADPKDRRQYFLHVFARMKAGITPEQAKSDLDRLIIPILTEESS